MTPAMNPGMKGQPQAGLAALAQPAQAPRGMSSGSMQQILERARMMSDSQLADILSGKSMDVPQYVAMTEAMGRKSLRNAMQGAQAMAQAKQPSVKDKMLAEDAQEQMAQEATDMSGIAAIPAPNMDTVDMAGGGIIAFQNTGLVEDENLDGMAYLSGQDPASLMKDKYRIEELLSSRKAAEAGKKLQEDKERYEFLKTAAPEAAAKMVKDNPSLIAPVAAAMPPVTTKGPATAAPDTSAGPKIPGVGTAPGAQAYSIPSFESLQGKRSEEYLAKLEGIGEKRRAGLAEIKKQGQGEALMQMGAGLFSAPTLGQGLAKGLPLVSSTAGATRREARALESSADDYDLNVAKAREAAEKGDTALALQYTQLANQAKAQNDLAKFQQGQLGLLGQRVSALTGKGSTYSLDKAVDDFNKIMKDPFDPQAKALKKLGITTPQQYQQYVVNQSGTMGAPGPDLAAAARAELERRK
jgi:hypothetical protein